MATPVKKYNPGFLSDDEIIDSICVRTNEFESIVESLRESTGNSNPHTIVIGPRGSGKTHLLVRIAAQVRRDESLDAFFPIVFPEESYEISTIGEFWLECLHHLTQQAPIDEQQSLNLSYNDLRNETKDEALAERCIGALLDFADRQQKRLLLVVENLNMLFDDINDPEVGWQLRKTLQTEHRIMLLGSATSRFNEIDDPQRALYDLFRVVTLRPLTTDDCLALWEAVAGSSTTFENVRPLEILTGGNPRLIAIIARFGSGRTFQELMDSLLDLVDDHTEYFKSHLEHLPPQERRVYLALARLWKPATTKEVADLARVGTNQCSSLLKRLTERGAVTIEGGTPRRRQFYLTERLYNIYYLLRRGGGTQPVVQALIDFMVYMYPPTELWQIVVRTLLDPWTLDDYPPDILTTVAGAIVDQSRSLFESGDLKGALAAIEPAAFGSDEIDSPEMRAIQPYVLNFAANLLVLTGRYDEAIKACDAVIMYQETHGVIVPTRNSANALLNKGIALVAIEKPEHAIRVLDEAERLYETVARSTDPAVYDVEMSTTLLGKATAFYNNNEPLRSISMLDRIIERYHTTSTIGVMVRVADALILKTLVLEKSGRTVSHHQFALLLALIPKTGLRDRCIEALVSFVVINGAKIGLRLMQESPATELLLPFVTALQQELGQTPRVAKEVEEVAKDIRKILAARPALVKAPPSASIPSKPSS